MWEWIQQVRPLHPSLDLWRPTADSRQEAEQSPPVTQDYLLQYIRDAQATSRFPDFGLAPAFSGQIGQGNKLELSFNMPNPGNDGIGLMIGEALGAALDASEDLADTLMHTTATIFAPNTIGALSRKGHPVRNLNRDGPYPLPLHPGLEDVLRLRLTPLPTSHPASHPSRPRGQRGHLHLRHPRHLPHHPQPMVTLTATTRALNTTSTSWASTTSTQLSIQDTLLSMSTLFFTKGQENGQSSRALRWSEEDITDADIVLNPEGPSTIISHFKDNRLISAQRTRF